MTSTVLPPLRAFFTTTCLSMRSLSAATWEMMPTRRSPSVRPARTRMACSRLSSSSEPKPSSRKRVSSRMPPAVLWTSSERPRASASEALKLSPPDRVLTLRRAAGLAADGPAASAVCGGLRAGPADGRAQRGPDGAAAPDAARPRRALLAQGRRHAGNGACGRRAALWRESGRFVRRPRAGRPGAPHPDDPQHAELPGPADGVWLAFVLFGRKAPMGLGRGRAVLPAVHHDRPRVGRVPACGRRRGACPAARQPRLTLAPAAQPQPCGRG